MGRITPGAGALEACEVPGPSTASPVHDGHVAVQVSVVVPAHNNPFELAKCISALRATADADTELIVVDDASTVDVSSVAANAGVRVLRLGHNAGPAAARNHGARHAKGEILFFVDSDVVVARDVIGRVRAMLGGHRGIAAVFGSYDSRPAAPGLVSQYRNLLHHFVHQTAKAEASTFWAGCGAVIRSAFEELGGFDEQRFPRPSIEDIELGGRLARAGYRIRLDKSLQGTHLKRWTLWAVIRTDIVHRAIPWSRLMLENTEPYYDLNLRGSQRFSVALTGLSGLFIAASPFRPELLIPAGACVAAILVINRDLFRFFWRVRGAVFATACVPLHLLYYLCCGVGYQYARLLSTLQTGTACRRGRPSLK
jgi:GT2 family glycosyltransferase